MSDTCRTIREMMLADADGELDSRRQDEMHAHLATCPACRREFEALACTREALRAWEAPVVNPQLSVVFAERLAARRTRPFGGWRKAAWAAGMAAVLVIGLLSLRNADREEHVTRVVPPKPMVVIDTPGTEPASLAKGDNPVVPDAGKRVADATPDARNRRVISDNGDETPTGSNDYIPDAADTLVALMNETTPPAAVSVAPVVVFESPHDEEVRAPVANAGLDTDNTIFPPVTEVVAEKDAALLVVELWGETN